MNIVPFLWVAGGVQLLIAGANIGLPSRLRYRENLARLTPIVRQVFVVHSVYIGLVLVIFSALWIGYAPELASGSGLGRFLSASLALFWSLRVLVQLFYYDRELCRRYRAAHIAFTLSFLFLSGVFIAAALGAV